MSAFLDGAARIGERLCDEALHDGARCTWFGASMEPVGAEWRPTRRTFGGEIYAGTSGVALFLAQLYRFRPSEKLRATALAALEQALERAANDPSMPRGALYTGAFGVGFAAAESGALLDAAGYIERGLALIRRTIDDEDRSAREFDVVSGAAGRIGALIRLYARFRDAWLVDAAAAEGRWLIETADKSAHGWSWGFGPSKYLARNLTGYSHGASGVGLALLELHAITAEAAFLQAAEEAFRYERSCYSAQQRNWPDFRRMGSEGPNDPFSYGYAWCHGAPGIGMSRLQAWRLRQDDAIRNEAMIAIGSTRSSPLAMSSEASFGICHGIAGNAELFLQAFEILGDAESLSFAESVGRKGLEDFGNGNGPWPAGLMDAGETPGLMLGLAGIGYFYLRLHAHRDVPSVLTMGS